MRDLRTPADELRSRPDTAAEGSRHEQFGGIDVNDDVVLFELDGGVATLTLNRPERRNAWTIEMHRRYWELLEQCDGDPRSGRSS